MSIVDTGGSAPRCRATRAIASGMMSSTASSDWLRRRSARSSATALSMPSNETSAVVTCVEVGNESQPRPRHHGERPLRSGDQRRPVQADRLLREPAQRPDDGAVGEHRLDADHLLAHRAEPHDTGATGVGRDRTADRGRLARREVDRRVESRAAAAAVRQSSDGHAGPGGDLECVAGRPVRRRSSRRVDSTIDRAPPRPTSRGTLPPTSPVLPPCVTTSMPCVAARREDRGHLRGVGGTNDARAAAAPAAGPVAFVVRPADRRRRAAWSGPTICCRRSATRCSLRPRDGSRRRAWHVADRPTGLVGSGTTVSRRRLGSVRRRSPPVSGDHHDLGGRHDGTLLALARRHARQALEDRRRGRRRDHRACSAIGWSQRRVRHRSGQLPQPRLTDRDRQRRVPGGRSAARPSSCCSRRTTAPTSADLFEGANLAELERINDELAEVDEVYSVVTPLTSLEFSSNLVANGVGSAALLSAASRDEAGAEARQADIAIALARLGAVPRPDDRQPRLQRTPDLRRRGIHGRRRRPGRPADRGSRRAGIAPGRSRTSTVPDQRHRGRWRRPDRQRSARRAVRRHPGCPGRPRDRRVRRLRPHGHRLAGLPRGDQRLPQERHADARRRRARGDGDRARRAVPGPLAAAAAARRHPRRAVELLDPRACSASTCHSSRSPGCRS